MTVPPPSDRHVLLLPEGTDVRDVERLVRDRYPAAELADDGAVRLDAATRLSAPARTAAVPGATAQWSLAMTVEAPAGTDVLDLLLGLARRLGGAVRVAGSGQVVVPTPEDVVDIVVHGPSWLEPPTVLSLVATDHPEARLATEGEQWLDPTSDSVKDAYAVVLDLGPGGRDGVIEVIVHIDEEPEPAIANRDWAEDAVAYWVRWTPPRPPSAEPEPPGPELSAARHRAAVAVSGIARVLGDATGGVAVDADGFLLEDYRL